MLSYPHPPAKPLFRCSSSSSSDLSTRSDSHLEDALQEKLQVSMAVEGTLQLPCLPALAPRYEHLIVGLFNLFGQAPSPEEQSHLRQQLTETLTRGFEESPRRYLSLSYHLVNPQQGLAGGIALNLSLSSPPEAQQSFQLANQSRFGRYPDAKAMRLAASLGEAQEVSVLDIGAGIGRNSLPLAKRGHPVDAVVTNSEAAAQLQQMTDSRHLCVNLLAPDLLEQDPVQGEYSLILAPEVLPHLRSPQAVRHLFEQGQRLLAPTGRLLLGAFLAEADYTPKPEVRDLAQACGCAFLTRSELEDILKGVGLQLDSVESVVDYESQHLPSAAWLPSDSFLTWATGQELFPHLLTPPIQFYWLTCRGLD